MRFAEDKPNSMYNSWTKDKNHSYQGAKCKSQDGKNEHDKKNSWRDAGPRSLTTLPNYVTQKYPKMQEKREGWVWMGSVHSSLYPQSSPLFWLQSRQKHLIYQLHVLRWRPALEFPQ